MTNLWRFIQRWATLPWFESNGWHGWPYIWQRWYRDDYSPCSNQVQLAVYLTLPFISLCYASNYAAVSDNVWKQLDAKSVEWTRRDKAAARRGA